MSSASQLLYGATQGRLEQFPEIMSWTPLEMFSAGELGAWYQISDTTTLFQDSDETIPADTDGDPVHIVKDKSGNGWDLLLDPGGSRAVYKTDGTDHWLQFNGVDNRYNIANTMNIHNHTIVVKFNCDSLSEQRAIIANDNETNKLALVSSTRDFFYRPVPSKETIDTDIADVVGLDTVFTAYRDLNADIFGRVNGSQVAGPLTITDPASSAYDMVGAASSGVGVDAHFSGRVYELILSENVDADNITEAEAWVS